MTDTAPTPSRRAVHWRPGVALHDGKLYHFEPRSAVVMRLWPEMRAWRRTPCTPWAHTRRRADEILCRAPLRPGQIEEIAARRDALVGPLSPDQWYEPYFREAAAWSRSLSTIPDREREIASRFKDRRWHLLAMMARCPGAADLLESNPALGFALASPWVLHQPAVRQPMRTMRALVNRPQARIQAWLGFPATERVRRILRRIDPGALSARLLPSLRRGLRDDAVTHLLAHLPRINEEVLRWVLRDDARRVATPGFLHELAAIAPLDAGAFPEPTPPPGVPHGPVAPTLALGAPMLRVWVDTCRKCDWLGRQRPAAIRSVRQLNRWFLDVEVAVLDHHDRRSTLPPDDEWAQPPWPGTETIRPLVTQVDLHEEGSAMQHCVESYAGLVAWGEYAVYRVLEPVRATLGLHRLGGDWRVDQAQAAPGVALPASVRTEIVRSLTGGALS